MIQISWQEMQNEDHSFKEKLGQAMKDGFFYLGIPEELKPKLPSCVKYAENLQNNTELKSHDLGGKTLGYRERQNTQIITFNTVKPQWKHVFPNEILDTANAMYEIGLTVLKKSLLHLEIPEEDWDLATGQSTNNQGEVFFSLNQYKPEKQNIGLIPHKDMGLITVLFINKHGLEKRTDDGLWEDIPPKEGYFVVNFGQTFEILIGSATKLKACIHRVRQLQEERMSFVTFIHQKPKHDMYTVNNEGKVIRAGSHEDLAQICFNEFRILQQEMLQSLQS